MTFTFLVTDLSILLAGFDGNKSDPLGGDFGLSAGDYSWATHAVYLPYFIFNSWISSYYLRSHDLNHLEEEG